MNGNENLINIAVILFVYMNLFYVAAVVTKKFSLVDIAWPFGFSLVGFFSGSDFAPLLYLWSLRLGFYLLRRNAFAEEDPRYTKLRVEWGKQANLKAYFNIFMFQGALMFIISLPFLFGEKNFDAGSVMGLLGIGVFLAGFTLESYADLYLSHFKKHKKKPGELCMSGPWAYCRFPNYLGEITLWYGFYLMTFSLSSWWTILSPLLLNILIVKLTGVAPLEEKYKSRADYRVYASRVRRLIWIKEL